MTVPRRRHHGRDERGQSMVEMALILPVLLLIVLGTLEFGFAFDHHLTLSYATREGARSGAALAAGCTDGEGVDPSAVDAAIIDAVERVLFSDGSPLSIGDVSEIRIYSANANGSQVGSDANVWVYSEATNGFVLQGAEGWPASDRDNDSTPESIGVSTTYQYHLRTPFQLMLGEGLTMTDRTVMQLSPTDCA